jgi:hypothetical protein
MFTTLFQHHLDYPSPSHAFQRFFPARIALYLYLSDP